ncbi:hypothetical protein [Trichothermofontia sp.]
MKLRLEQYPDAIAQAAQAANALEHQIAIVKQQLANLEAEAEVVVAFDSTLKNDLQRKARRHEVLQANPAYAAAQEQFLQLTTEKANALAYLEQLQNHFSVAKLETRLRIVQQLTGLESRELVGL